MKTERVFLMELFLDDELPKKIKLLIKDRFQEMDVPTITYVEHPRPNGSQQFSGQSPSMQRIMAQNPDLVPKVAAPVTPAAAEALAQRQALINKASEKPQDGRRSPRKI